MRRKGSDIDGRQMNNKITDGLKFTCNFYYVCKLSMLKYMSRVVSTSLD
jgi:hypothetical protein